MTGKLAQESQLDECLGFVDCILSNENYTDVVVIIGDTSFDCTEGNNGYDRFANLLSGFNIFHCDNFMLIKVTDLLISIMLQEVTSPALITFCDNLWCQTST